MSRLVDCVCAQSTSTRNGVTGAISLPLSLLSSPHKLYLLALLPIKSNCNSIAPLGAITLSCSAVQCAFEFERVLVCVPGTRNK